MVIESLTECDFTELGVVLSLPNNNRMGDDRFSYWKEIAVFTLGTLTNGLLRVAPRDKVVTELERHSGTPELLTVLSGTGVVTLAAPGESPEGRVRSIRIRQGDSFALDTGTWHGLVIPEGDQEMVLLVQFKQGTEDTDIDFFELKKPIRID